MNIVYVARPGANANDDEGAVEHALRLLGHSVTRVSEYEAGGVVPLSALAAGDLLLFNKWYNPAALRALAGKTRIAFWYWDLVEFADPALERRNATRRAWMREITPHADLGFCTDGDWVERDVTGKLKWLAQGADERVVGFGRHQGTEPEGTTAILFTGSRRYCGTARGRFLDHMTARYGPLFRQVTAGLYGRRLADAISAAAVFVCPDGPVTDRYWSNRVYVAAGFGACIVHPHCARLAGGHYPGRTVAYYAPGDRTSLDVVIRACLDSPVRRQEMSEAALDRTLKCHLYRHRCEELIRVVNERLP